jgi:hypothetical protein
MFDAKPFFDAYQDSFPSGPAAIASDTVYPGGEFPFSYPVITDPIAGRTDGLLARCLAAGNCPKIIQTDTELEFYQSRRAFFAAYEPVMTDNHRSVVGEITHAPYQCREAGELARA